MRVLHSLIQALVDQLPPVGTEWPMATRRKWFRAAEAILDLLYFPTPAPQQDHQPTDGTKP